MKKTFKREIESLRAVFEFVHGFIEENGLEKKLRLMFDLALEELFVNMVRYNQENTNPVEIELLLDDEKFEAVLIDRDVDEFDISRYEPYETQQLIEERRVGGIGIHLVKKVMDDVSYEYKDRISRVVLTKYLRKSHV